MIIMINEAKKPKMVKVYKITNRHSSWGGRDREYSHTGTLEELIEYHHYTLEKGKSWEHEKGNHKINMKPRTIKDLVKNLQWAADNAAANGYSGDYYSYEELGEQPVEELQENKNAGDMDKRKLYESIMSNVAKEVKKALNESSFSDIAESKRGIFEELAKNKDKSAFINEAFNEATHFMEMFKKSGEKEYLFTVFKIIDGLRQVFYDGTGTPNDGWSDQYGSLLSVIEDGYGFQYVDKLPLIVQRRLRRPSNDNF